jgi:hypothetical protein
MEAGGNCFGFSRSHLQKVSHLPSGGCVREEGSFMHWWMVEDFQAQSVQRHFAQQLLHLHEHAGEEWHNIGESDVGLRSCE